jgi:hypothetical protein
LSGGTASTPRLAVRDRKANSGQKSHIPSSHIPNFTPGLPHDAVPLIRQRDGLRQVDPLDPSIANLNEEISKITRKSARKTWIYKVEACGPSSNPTKFWSLIGNLSGKRVSVPKNLPITFNNKPFNKPEVIASKFNAQFTSVSTQK